MRRKLSLVILSALFFVSLLSKVQADDTQPVSPWKFDGFIGLNATGTGLVNWTGGGKNTASGLAFVNLHLKYYNGTLIADEEGVWAERVQFKANVGIRLGYSF